ncbi:YihY/virulence factor BrkB family protein [Micrococcus lacusdianchii]|uniref:YihY/virulence factor BrkB family protein n=1 Tax=Micrococcus lacusdianchii TaxID=2915940 RepID=UPI0020030E46
MATHPVDATLEAAKIDPEERTERLKGIKLDGAGWKYAVTRAFKEFMNDGGTDLAAKLTYFMVLSLAPSLLAVFSILTLVLASNRSVVDDLVTQLTTMVPSDYQSVVQSVVENLMQQSTGGIIALVIGILTAVWSASAYVKAFNRASNQVYNFAEGRGFIRLLLSNLLTTVVMLLGIVLVLISLALNRSLVDGLLAPIAQPLGLTSAVNFLSDTFLPIWAWVKWPVVVLLVLVLIATLYYMAPNVKKPSFRMFGPGNIFALVGMVLASVGLYFYFTQLAGYSAYGAIGGVMALLFALWIFNIVLLLGLELDTEVERAKQLIAGMPAEEAVKLPPKDADALVKKAEKQEELEQKGYELRATHGGGDSAVNRPRHARDGGAHAADKA